MSWLPFFLVLAAPTAAAPAQQDTSDFCAVRLTVTNANDGQPVRSAVAELIDHSGRVVQTRDVVDGRAEFCDFGFGRYSILIHDNFRESLCGAVEIKNIRALYGHKLTQRLRAVLNDCGEGDLGLGNACSFYVRVAAPDGRPLRGVEIKAGAIAPSEHTDSYGRGRLSVRKGTRTDFTFAQSGYKPKHLLLGCASLLDPEKQLSVVLEPEKALKAR